MNQQPGQPEPTPQPRRSISEIGHLFLSSVRELHANGQSRPVRLPPQARQEAEPIHSEGAVTHRHQTSIDLTPEEYAQVFGGPEASGPQREPAETRIPPITALVTVHLNGRAEERVREYARHLAANGERIGVVEVDGSEFRLTRFERSINPDEGHPAQADVVEHFDHRFMSEALEEMGWDLDRWLLVLPSMRSPEARGLLKEVDHWAVLSTCDHDGVVSCYRTLKGLSGGLDEGRRPRMTLALLEAPGEAVAAKVLRKLKNVCLQFLGIELEGEDAVRPTRAVAGHVVLNCRMNRDKAQLAAGVQWIVVGEFLARARAQAAEDALRETQREEEDLRSQISNPKSESSNLRPGIPNFKSQIPDFKPRISNEESAPQAPSPEPLSAHDAVQSKSATPASPPRQETPSVIDDVMLRRPVMKEIPPGQVEEPAREIADEVIDLPGDAITEQAVVAAVLGGAKAELIECPVRAPMCPDARLAVTRERDLVVLAVARKGLRELRLIAQAYRWAIENRALIAMAVPQLSIDAHRHPRLKLIVDHADLSAEVLAPMLESDAVSVQAYRKLRWGGKTGLLLEAA
jgi:hypothetical protein